MAFSNPPMIQGNSESLNHWHASRFLFLIVDYSSVASTDVAEILHAVLFPRTKQKICALRKIYKLDVFDYSPALRKVAASRYN